MAKAKKKVRPETPPLYATIDNGVIKPAFAFDAERLASYRNHAKVFVWIDYEGSRPGQRKWYAVIQTALKGGNLPWADLSSADISLRLALEMYEPRKTNDGNWHRVPSSLNDYDDKELDEKVELLQALIYRLTGIDPKDFERERAGAGDERFETDKPATADNQNAGTAEPVASSSGSATLSPDALPPSSGGVLTDSPMGQDSIAAGNDIAPQAAGGDATNSDEATNQAMVLEADTESAGDPASNSAASAPLSSGEEKAAGEGDGAVSPPAAELSEADRAWLKLGAHWMLAALPDDDPEALRVLVVQVAEIRKVMPKDVSRAALQRMESMRLHCRDVCDGKEKLDKRFMAETALTTPAEIEPKPIKTSRAAQ